MERTEEEVRAAEIEAAYQAREAIPKTADRRNRRPQMWCVVLCSEHRIHSEIVGPFFHKGSAIHTVLTTLNTAARHRTLKRLTPLLSVQAFPADDEMKE